MKRIVLFFAIAMAAVSCAPEVSVTPELTVLTDGDELVITPGEGVLKVEFSTNVDWTAKVKETDAEPWCVVTPSKGKAGDIVMDVICIENKGTENRTATIEIKAMDLTQEVVVTQLQKDVLVLTAENEYDVPYQGQNLEFKVAHNLDLKVTSDVDWITEVKARGLKEETYTFAVAPNTGEARTGKITFAADPFKEEIIVRQDAWVLEFNIDPAGDKIFESAGGEYKMTVASNVDYYVNVEDNDWLTMSVSGDEYTFTAAPNDGMKARETEVRISPKSAKYVEHSKIVKMSQKSAGAKLEVSELDKRITCLAQSFELTVDANVDYQMTYKKSVDGEYVDVDAADRWLSHTVSGNTYTFTATENTEWTERSLVLVFAPKDAAYSDMMTEVVVRQYGHAFLMWSQQITSIDGYDPAQKLRLAVYDGKILLANTAKVYMIDPATGDVVGTVQMPDGVAAHSLMVDDAGNLLIAADGAVDQEMTLYHIADPMNPTPEVVLSYHTGNYYGSHTGNFRVKGNIKDDAVITAVVSDGQDGENLEDGAILIWEVTDGKCSEWNWTNAPYTAWDIASLCCYPTGSSLSDGLFFIGYGGDYNLKYSDSPVMNPVKAEVAEGETPYYVQSSSWETSYVTGSTWQENYNCISTAEWKGNKYAAILQGCHFNYDDAGMILLDVNDPAAASYIYNYECTYDVERDDAWANLWWTGSGIYSDILLVPTDDALLMVGADSNYGTFTCIAIM
ncbi:MAG: hypothetical protein IKU36_08260 [Bacteroidales bacterium]|nr:hypothetical protein [Bacteroidales bacterium]